MKIQEAEQNQSGASNPEPPRNGRSQELAECGSPTDEIQLKGDDRLFRALVSGCHVENAAIAAGVSERTAYRRLADPEFRQKIDEARQSLRESILAKLADAGHDAIGVLTDLMHSAEDERMRLMAAKSVLDSLTKFQQNEKPKASSKADLGQASSGRVVIYIPDNERDPQVEGLPRAAGNIE